MTVGCPQVEQDSSCGLRVNKVGILVRWSGQPSCSEPLPWSRGSAPPPSSGVYAKEPPSGSTSPLLCSLPWPNRLFPPPVLLSHSSGCPCALGCLTSSPRSTHTRPISLVTMAQTRTSHHLSCKYLVAEPLPLPVALGVQLSPLQASGGPCWGWDETPQSPFPAQQMNLTSLRPHSLGPFLLDSQPWAISLSPVAFLPYISHTAPRPSLIYLDHKLA